MNNEAGIAERLNPLDRSLYDRWNRVLDETTALLADARSTNRTRPPIEVWMVRRLRDRCEGYLDEHGEKPA